MGEKTPPAAINFIVNRALYRLTCRDVEAATLIVTKGPLSPLTDMQSIAMRVAFNTSLREAVAIGRWAERAKNGSTEDCPMPSMRPKSQTIIVDPGYLGENPGFDEDSTTETIVRKKTPMQRLRDALEVLKRAF